MASRKLKIDMTGVESYTRCSEGEHLVRVKKMEMGQVQGSGDDALKAVFEVIQGSDKGCQVFETFSLGEKALWKLKQFLMAIGMKADGKLNLDLDKLEGKICVIDVIHDEYNGTKRAKISSYLKPTEESGEDDEEEEDDEDDDEDEEEEPVKKPAKKASSKKSNKKQLEPVDDDEDDEDDEEEAPPKKSVKKPAKKAPAPAKGKKAKQPEPEEEDDDDDDDWEEDDD